MTVEMNLQCDENWVTLNDFDINTLFSQRAVIRL